MIFYSNSIFYYYLKEVKKDLNILIIKPPEKNFAADPAYEYDLKTF